MVTAVIIEMSDFLQDFINAPFVNFQLFGDSSDHSLRSVSKSNVFCQY